jgi:gliding motility-associated-like protein
MTTHIFFKTISIFLFIMIQSSRMQAATITWVGGNYNNEWNQVVNWSPMIVPGINDEIIIPTSWTSEITIIGANASCRSITYTGTGFNININTGWEFLLAGDLNITGNSNIYGLGGIEIVGNNDCNLNFSDSTHIAVSHINIKSDANTNLNNDLIMPLGRLNIFSGSFITHGYTLNLNSISMIDGSTSRTLNIENSQVTINTMNLNIRNNGYMFTSNSVVNNKLMIITDGDVSFNVINSANRSSIGIIFTNVHFSVTQLNAEGDISLLGSTTQTGQIFSITEFNVLSSPSLVRLTPEPYVSGYYFYTIHTPAGCIGEVQFTDGFEVNNNQVQFYIIGGADLSKASLANIRIVSGSFIVEEGTDIGNNSGIIFNQSTTNTYYWINGQGNWNDPLHWSATSGGASSGCIPGLKDNAIFDNGSGFGATDTVFVSDHTFCKDLIAYAAIINKPVFSQLSGSVYSLNIFGNVDLSGFSDYKVFYPVYFWNKTNSNIRTASHMLLDDVYMLNIGTCQLQDALNCYDGQKTIYQMQGNFITNGHSVTIASIISKGAKVMGSVRGLSLFNSTLHIGHPSLSGGGVLVYSENLNLNAGTSHFIFEYLYNINSEFKIEGIDPLNFYNLTYLNEVGSPQIVFNQKSSFNKIQFNGNGRILGGCLVATPDMSNIDTLVITGNYRYELQENRIINIRKKVVHQHSLCNEISLITSTSLANRAYIHSNGLGALNFENTWIENISGVGPNLPFIVNNGINGGNNLNLNFISLNAPRIFYWNGEGNTSHWSEGANWNIGILPHSGDNNDPILYNTNGCTPGFNDSVVFHINSFPVIDTVAINENINFCGMNWMAGTGTGRLLSGNSQFTLNNYGGLRFDNNLGVVFAGDFFFRSPYTREIQFNHVPYYGVFNFYQLGKCLLMDDLICNGYAIQFLAGSFTSNSHRIQTNHFFIFHDTAPANNNTVDFGSSRIDVSGTFANHLYNHVSTFIGDQTMVYMNGPSSTLTIQGDIPVVNFGHVNFTLPYGNVGINSYYYNGSGIPYFQHVNFEPGGSIIGDNSIDTLILAEGKDYFLGATETQFINKLLYSKGSPCYRTSIQSTIPGTRAFIKNTNCNLLVEHARLRDMEGILGSCGVNNYLVGVGGEDLGNNYNWHFIPGNPINGLGPDTVLTCNTLPYLQTSAGFGRYESITWSTGSTAPGIVIDTVASISATVIYSPVCTVFDKREFSFEDQIHQIGIVDPISCYGMNNGSIQLHIDDVDSNYNQTWIYPSNQMAGTDTLIDQLVAGTYTSIVTVPGYENMCTDTAQFIILEPQRLTVSLDTTISGKCSDPDGMILISSMGGSGEHQYTWSNGATTEDNYTAFGGINEVIVRDTNACLAKLSVDLSCIDHINIPELISPNGDGYSDNWEIIDLFRLYPDNDVKIINRWGNTVYHKKGYSDEFDGIPNTGDTFSVGYLPSGTYFYIINLGEKYKTLTGYVELIY